MFELSQNIHYSAVDFRHPQEDVDKHWLLSKQISFDFVFVS